MTTAFTSLVFAERGTAILRTGRTYERVKGSVRTPISRAMAETIVRAHGYESLQAAEAEHSSEGSA